MKKKNTLLAIACAALLGLPEAAAQQPLRLSQADCREMALQHSEALQKADNARKQAELDQGIARSAYLPKIDASATGTYLFPDMDMMGMELRMRGTYMAGINLTQPLYAGGQITAGQRLARIGRESAGEQFRMLICPDHPTPIVTGTHASDPVPYLIYHRGGEKQGVETINEQTAKATGVFVEHGPDIMKKFLEEA